MSVDHVVLCGLVGLRCALAGVRKLYYTFTIYVDNRESQSDWRARWLDDWITGPTTRLLTDVEQRAERIILM